MTRHRRSIRLVLQGLVCSFGLAAWNPAMAQPLIVGGEEIASAELMAAARKEGRLVYYGTVQEISAKIITGGFTGDTGIRVTYLRLTTQKMFPRITAEHAAGRLEADITEMTDLPLVHELADMGILEGGHRVPGFERIARELRDDKARWYAFYRPVSVLSVNTALVAAADMPKNYLDAFNPRWSGRIGFPSIDVGGSAFAQFMFLRDRIDPAYWTKLAAMKPRIYPAILPATSDLARGETAMVLGGASTALDQIAQGVPLKIIFPAEGIAAFPISGGMLAGARNKNAAKLFISWLMSKRASGFIASAGSYATHPEAPAPVVHGVVFPPPAQVWNAPLDEWLKKRDSYSREWRDLFTGGR